MAREWVLPTAFRRFYAHGVRGVGSDTVINESGVAKAYEVMEKNVGSLYPTPAVVIGTMVNKKVNWVLVRHPGMKL